MLDHLRSLAMRAYGQLPWQARVFLVRRLTPSFWVGAMCMVERPDGAVLLVRHSYRRGWGLPGGLLKRNEEPAAGAARETLEEVGLTLELDPDPEVVVDARSRRIDFIYQACLEPGEEPSPRSPEILDVKWFEPGDLPPLQDETAAALDQLQGVPAGPRRGVIVRGRVRPGRSR